MRTPPLQATATGTMGINSSVAHGPLAQSGGDQDGDDPRKNDAEIIKRLLRAASLRSTVDIAMDEFGQSKRQMKRRRTNPRPTAADYHTVPPRPTASAHQQLLGVTRQMLGGSSVDIENVTSEVETVHTLYTVETAPSGEPVFPPEPPPGADDSAAAPQLGADDSAAAPQLGADDSAAALPDFDADAGHQGQPFPATGPGGQYVDLGPAADGDDWFTNRTTGRYVL